MSDERKDAFSCDWQPPGVSPPQPAEGQGSGSSGGPPSCVHPFSPGTHAWEGITPEAYKTEAGGWAGIVRHTLIGGRGEAAAFDLRYFEIAPGGNSSLERHRHVHVVVCIRGRGRILCGGAEQELNFLDLAYVAPDDPHQLSNPFDEPFGFFCLVDHERDRPQVLDLRGAE